MMSQAESQELYLTEQTTIANIEAYIICDNALETDSAFRNYLDKIREVSYKSSYIHVLKGDLKRYGERNLVYDNKVKTGDNIPLDIDLLDIGSQEVLREIVLSNPRLLRIFKPVLNVYSIEFDESTCTLCGACEAACPHDAIRVKHTASESVELVFDPFKCTGCFNCLFACPERSIKGFTRVHSSEFIEKEVREVVLVGDSTVKCSVCGSVIGPRRSIEKIEKELIEKGFPENLVRESTRVCARCKSSLFLASRLSQNP